MISGIYNAFIEEWNIEKSERYYETIVLLLTVKSTQGTAILTLSLDNLKRLFDILKISDIKDLKGRPCLALFSDSCIRTIGDFMFPNYNFKYDESKYWLDYDIYLKYGKEMK